MGSPSPAKAGRLPAYVTSASKGGSRQTSRHGQWASGQVPFWRDNFNRRGPNTLYIISHASLLTAAQTDLELQVPAWGSPIQAASHYSYLRNDDQAQVCNSPRESCARPQFILSTLAYLKRKSETTVTQGERASLDRLNQRNFSNTFSDRLSKARLSWAIRPDRNTRTSQVFSDRVDRKENGHEHVNRLADIFGSGQDGLHPPLQPPC